MNRNDRGARGPLSTHKPLLLQRTLPVRLAPYFDLDGKVSLSKGWIKSVLALIPIDCHEKKD